MQERDEVIGCTVECGREECRDCRDVCFSCEEIVDAVAECRCGEMCCAECRWNGGEDCVACARLAVVWGGGVVTQLVLTPADDRFTLPGRRPCTQPPGPRTWSVWTCDSCRPRMCSRLTMEGANDDE